MFFRNVCSVKFINACLSILDSYTKNVFFYSFKNNNNNNNNNYNNNNNLLIDALNFKEHIIYP